MTPVYVAPHQTKEFRSAQAGVEGELKEISNAGIIFKCEFKYRFDLVFRKWIHLIVRSCLLTTNQLAHLDLIEWVPVDNIIIQRAIQYSSKRCQVVAYAFQRAFPTTYPLADPLRSKFPGADAAELG